MIRINYKYKTKELYLLYYEYIFLNQRNSTVEMDLYLQIDSFPCCVYIKQRNLDLRIDSFQRCVYVKRWTRGSRRVPQLFVY